MDSHDLGELDLYKLCPEWRLGQCNDQSLSAMSQKLFISQSTPRPEYICQKQSFKKSTELCGFYEYIFNCRDKNGVFDMSPNLPTNLSV